VFIERALGYNRQCAPLPRESSPKVSGNEGSAARSPFSSIESAIKRSSHFCFLFVFAGLSRTPTPPLSSAINSNRSFRARREARRLSIADLERCYDEQASRLRAAFVAEVAALYQDGDEAA
jgi:hypothetical protein